MSRNQQHAVIIGGGIIGAATLYYLTQHASPPARITLIEEADEIAPGASGKAGGFLALDWHSSETADLARLSYKLHKELAASEGGAKIWGYREVETLEVKFDSSKKSSRGPSELDWVDRTHVYRSNSMGGGGTTAQVVPALLAAFLVQKSRDVAASSGNQFSVDVRFGTRAKSLILSDDGRVQSVNLVERGSESHLAATDVVIAAGPWSGSLVKDLVPSALLRSPPKELAFLTAAAQVSGSRAHSIVVRGSRPTTAHCLFTDMRYSTKGGASKAAGPEVYARDDGTIYICGGSDNVPLPTNVMKVNYDKKQTAQLREQAAVLSPDVLGPSASVEKEQACYLPTSALGCPLLTGAPQKGLYISAGHSCWGVTLSLGTGLCMSELVCDGIVTSADVNALQRV